MTETDVVVVGAGAAGLAAGEWLAANNRDFLVLEAADRIGGRAFTDTSVFGVPFDHGCHWLHSASVNPFREIADALGHRYLKRASRRAAHMFLKDCEASDEERQAAWEAVEGAFRAAETAGRLGRDVAASRVVRPPAPWKRLANHWLRLLSSLDPDEISTLDLARYSDTGENWPVLDGYGALVAAAGRTVPVRTGVAVTAIDWSGPGVRVETASGSIRARAVIVTVSTNVLASGGIRFEPGLPADYADAIAACPCGYAEKVAISFDRPLPGLEDVAYLDTIDPTDKARPAVNFTVYPDADGLPVAVGQLGGGVSRDLERAGEAAMIDFALQALVDAFGSDLGDRVKRTAVTRWASDPLIQGAYSCALPGKAQRRLRLCDPIADRVFLAGEATSAEAYSTAHGARLSGLRAARQAVSAASM
ncbi:flavin monoamine oxidase family protein [Amorphus orientalis]|uniref:Tryptophan 2-monooxygenase n=1 Tax=Amorphus orientalis TaxID=649198 RepID=A0AAE3VNS3_9HYPH|nr:NAD(P)/FAD-dependent oxidoreductase [Amorphus orientalis]MDQ0315288.1 monoamine oxidase [Amorphus orientalis]